MTLRFGFLVLCLVVGLATAADGQSLSHFTPAVRTGNSAVVVIPPRATPSQGRGKIETGDEIAVSTEGGFVAGAGVWKAGQSLALTVWADDSLTSEVDGFRVGEKLTFIMWDRSERVERSSLGADFASSPLYRSTPTFQMGAIYLVQDLDFSVRSDGDRSEVPSEAYLTENYPNPFNASTSLEYGLSTRRSVSIDVFDVLGRHVATLVEGRERPPGRYTVRWDAFGHPSGEYYVVFRAGSFRRVRSVVLVK